jgi:hypothetical protein
VWKEIAAALSLNKIAMQILNCLKLTVIYMYHLIGHYETLQFTTYRVYVSRQILTINTVSVTSVDRLSFITVKRLFFARRKIHLHM